MGFTEILTLIFIVLKLLGKIDWNWLIVLSPEIVAGILYVIVSINASRTFRKTCNRIERDWDDFHNRR